MSRGRKAGSILVDCPECTARIVVVPGEKKTCKECGATFGKMKVKRAIADEKRAREGK